MLLSAHLVSLLHLCVRAHSNLLPDHQQMQVQQTNKGCPDCSIDGHVASSNRISANLYKGVERRILRCVPHYLHDDMPATYYNNDHL